MSNSKFIPKIDEGTFVYWASEVPQKRPILDGIDFIKSRMVIIGTPPEIVSKVLYLTQNN